MTQIWVVTRHQYGISAPVSQTSFRGKTSDGVAKCRLFLRLPKAFPELPQACLLQSKAAIAYENGHLTRN